MKIARLDTLARQDDIFFGGEPDTRYKKRQLIVVEDDYDFGANNATDVTNIDNLKFAHSSSKINYIEYRDALVLYATTVTFSNLTTEEKEELCINFAVDKTYRDSIFSGEEQKKYAKEMQKLVDKANEQVTFDSNSLGISDETGVPDTTTINLSNAYGSYVAETSSEGETSTSSKNSYSTKITLTTSNITSGKYRIGWYYETNGATNKSHLSTVVLNSSSSLSDNNIEYKDSNSWEPHGGFKYEVLEKGVHTVDIQFKPSSNITVKIRRARIEILKIT